MRHLFVAIAALFLLVDAAPVRAASDEGGPFPRPYALHPQIRFWTRIYTEVDTSGGFVHDADHLDVVYETLRLPEGIREATFQNRVDDRKAYYRDILRGLADGRREGLSDDEQRVLQLWPSGVSSETLRRAAENVRFQLGQADRFREGVERSGRWEAHIRETLVAQGVPADLAALPHVESSYNPQAYSHAGAAGLWQFMRSTGRRFLRVDDVVDERFDPWRSSEAAARYLAENHRVTGSWPLAVTAYNHGAGGMRRAAQALGTTDIGAIVRRYKSPSFGFASRNFYASFLAALDVSRSPERHFGAIERSRPEEPETLVLSRSTSVGTLRRTLAVDLDTLREYNLALRTPFWMGRRYAPAGYALRLPPERGRGAAVALASAPAERAPETPAKARTRTYRVAKGDTISRIARRFAVSEKALIRANRLDPRRLRAGAVLRIPVPPAEPEVLVAAAPSAPAPAPAPSPLPAETLAIAPKSPDPTEPQPSPAAVAADDAATRATAEAAPVPVPEIPAQPAEPAERVASPAEARAVALAELPVEGADTAPPPEPAPPATEPSAASAPEPRRPAPVAATEPGPAAGEPPAAALAQANPSRYRVDAKGAVRVQPDETLGHFAQWLGVPISRLRSMNGLRKGASVAIGRRLVLDFSKTSQATFEARRLAHHEALRREFFDTYQVAGTEEILVRKGDTIWSLSRGTVPVWLLHHYNPDLDLASIRPGVRVTIPRVSPRG